jgi:hypothetical protein
MDILRTATLGCAIILGAAVIAGTFALSFRYQTTIAPAEMLGWGPTVYRWDRWTDEITVCRGETIGDHLKCVTYSPPY